MATSRATRTAGLGIPFELLPRIGGMATMPSRAGTLRAALPHVLAQVDRLYLYLDKHTEVPDWLAHMPKVACVLPTDGSRDLGTSGKFLGLRLYREPCLYFCFDDDIHYGEGYVRLLAAALRRYNYMAVAGLHGSVFELPPASYIRNKTSFHFAKGVNYDLLVDELGTGTVGFHSSVFELEPERWKDPNMADLHLMLEAVRQQLPRICVRRKPELATPIEQNQPDSLYVKALLNDTVQTRVLRRAMLHYPGRWCMSS